VSGALRQAKVYVSIMGEEVRQQLSLRGLQNSTGFLQSKVAKRIDTRYTPRLEFVLDLGVKRSIEISRILRDVLPPDSGDSAGRQATEAFASEGGHAHGADEEE
jgi:ribosome-binding factor A